MIFIRNTCFFFDVQWRRRTNNPQAIMPPGSKRVRVCLSVFLKRQLASSRRSKLRSVGAFTMAAHPTFISIKLP